MFSMDSITATSRPAKPGKNVLTCFACARRNRRIFIVVTLWSRLRGGTEPIVFADAET
jgi:hypothetical protein